MKFPIDEIKQLKHQAQSCGLEVDVMGMWEAYRHQYTMTHGSNKQYLGTPQYPIKEQQKQDYILDRIQETINNKMRTE